MRQRFFHADDALVAAILLVIIFEGGFMFLARKRLALSREGIQEGRAATEAELLPVIRELPERLRKLENATTTNP